MASDSDDDLFLKVAQELGRKEVDQALWTKAFSLEDGDDRRTKAHYIRLRVEKLRCRTEPDSDEHRSNKVHIYDKRKNVVEEHEHIEIAVPDKATPWQRFWARSIDFMLCLVLIQPVSMTLSSSENIWLNLVIAFVTSGAVLVLYDSVFTVIFGATIGKGIAGIRVRDLEAYRSTQLNSHSLT